VPRDNFTIVDESVLIRVLRFTTVTWSITSAGIERIIIHLKVDLSRKRFNKTQIDDGIAIMKSRYT
jgi:hypothetical protein